MSGHCDRMWNDTQIEVEQDLDELYSNLRSSFRNLSPSPNREGDKKGKATVRHQRRLRQQARRP